MDGRLKVNKNGSPEQVHQEAPTVLVYLLLHEGCHSCLAPRLLVGLQFLVP
ncbi:conserved hypothetical protein [Ricinus communis]|uniref:Uncharacterized protein n=1 Tax=Ricinus communis TaxID=3988 RepID=B9RRF7_RICCO|nr:conserved hypothetical protein [Ricinus communis]